jgi:hypothetical protein
MYTTKTVMERIMMRSGARCGEEMVAWLCQFVLQTHTVVLEPYDTHRGECLSLCVDGIETFEGRFFKRNLS